MRKLATYEGVVENGHVTLPPNVDIPEKTRVYVLVQAYGFLTTTMLFLMCQC